MRFTSFVDSIGWNIVAQPDAPALIWHDKQLTYSEFGTMTQNAADTLHELRLAEHVPVSIVDKKSPQFIALIFACLAERHPFLLPPAGLTHVALETLVEQAGCSHILSLEPDGAPCTVMARRPVSQPIRAGSEASAVGAEFMLTISGSAGSPKIVPITQGAVDRFAAWSGEYFHITPGKAVLNFAPLNFDLCFLDVWTSLAHGACVAWSTKTRRHATTLITELTLTCGINHQPGVLFS